MSISKPLKFEWNDQKREANLRKHGVDFKDVRILFRLPHTLELDLEHARIGKDGEIEERWHAVGEIPGLGKILVVHTELVPNLIRIISARKVK